MNSTPPTSPKMQDSSHRFAGFDPLTANYLYCTNQFFDVCLPNQSRGCVRLVAYLLRKTLGWLDGDGNPINECVQVSYRDFIEKAGISRGAVRSAIDESINSRYIACVQKPSPSAVKQSAQTASYTLRWDVDGDYTTDLKQFAGFYTKEGNRTPIPNAFFDHVIPNETLAVIKVVGAVLRHTVGYETQFGRRANAPLSFSYLQKYTRISDRSTLSAALHYALDAEYIQCVKAGRFDPHQPCAATYTVKWRQQAKSKDTSTKTRPVPVQKPDQNMAALKQYKNQTSSGTKTRPDEPYKNQTTEKTLKNNTSKQQQVVAVDDLNVLQLLQRQGIDTDTAKHLATVATPEQIRKQIEWLPQRKATTNPQGMLRRAIEQDWSPPAAVAEQQSREQLRRRARDRQEVEAAEREREIRVKRQRLHRLRALLRVWKELPTDRRLQYMQNAIDGANSHAIRSYLRHHRDMDNPPMEVLRVMAGDHPVSIGE